MSILRLATLALALVGSSAPRHAQCPSEELTPPEVDAGDHYGAALAADGRVLVVGAPDADVGAGPGAGAAFVFERGSDGWQQAAVLPAPMAADGGFGSAVDVVRKRAIVGSPFTDGAAASSGAAYVYEKSDAGEWELVVSLAASDAATDAQFGRSVTLFGPRIAVGAAGPGGGAVYVFERAGGSWLEVAKLQGPSGFGESIDLSQSRLLVGSQIYEDVAGTWQMTGSLFCLSCTGIRRGAITPDGTTVAIGALGGAFVYDDLGPEWSDGTFLDTEPIFASTPARVALRDDGSGVYASNLATIVSQNRIRAFDRQEGGWAKAGDFIPDAASFGSSVAWSAGSIIGGAPQPGVPGSGGRVFVFEDSVETYGEGTPGSAGLVPTIAVTGCPAPSANTSIFVLLGVGEGPGVLFIGTEKGELPLDTTTLWVSSIVATVGFTLDGPPGAPGIGSVELPIGVPPLVGLQGFAATLQALIVDPFAPNGVSSTAGYRMWIR